MTKAQSQTHQPLGAAYIHYASGPGASFGLDAQMRQIQECAASEGIELVKIYTDLVNRAYKRQYRPGIVKLLMDAKKGLFTSLYVYRIDSLARRLEWSLEIVKELEMLGVPLRALVDNPDPEIHRIRCGCPRRTAAGLRKVNLPQPIEINPQPLDLLHPDSVLRPASQRVPKAGSHQPEAAIKDRHR